MDQVVSENSTVASFIREAAIDAIENITFSPALVEKFGTSESLLLMWCAQWHAARADHLMVMAAHELSTGWGNLDIGANPDMSSIREMEKLQLKTSQRWRRPDLTAWQGAKVSYEVVANRGKESAENLRIG